MSLLEITGLSHTFGEGRLFKDAALTLERGEHMGMTGQNGAGKSTLIKICTGEVVPDAGRVVWQPGIAVRCMDQHAEIDRALTLRQFLRLAFAGLYALEEKMEALYSRAAEGDMRALDTAARYQETLEAQGFYTLDTQIAQVITGLGVPEAYLDEPVGNLSGGQRAKTILAKLLLEQPEVMLLDEPTNFLDKGHIVWLAGYLAQYSGAFIVISHDAEFLEKAVTCVADIEAGRITKYYGTYSEFIRKKTLAREAYVRHYAAQQKEIARTEEFIRRNIAGRKTKMAQGRRKQLARMDKLEAPAQSELRPRFRFPALPGVQGECLYVKNLAVGYGYPVLRGLDFTLKGGQKVVITGFNGIGKSTLLKTLTGQIPAIGGQFGFSPQAKTGYFAQDLLWEDKAKTPLEIICSAYPALSEKEARRRLAGSGISAKHAEQAVGTLSGGEQAKTKLCLLMLKPYNLLILDEPTNHLDREAKEALAQALDAFAGTVLLVCHEEAFYRDWAHRVIDFAK